MIRRPPRSTLFPTRRSSDLELEDHPLGEPLADARDRHENRLVLLHDRELQDRKSTRLNSSHTVISYAVFCLKKKKITITPRIYTLPLKTHNCHTYPRHSHYP